MIHPQMEKILPLVEKPGRYVGGEYNSVVKPNREDLVSFAFCFPDVYEVGMSHLGLRILYDVINVRDDACCERAFAPWTDMEAQMRENQIPLCTLESATPLCQFDLVGFTLQYEMSYTNILNMLELGGIALLAAQRGENDPFVLCGGPCAYNGEPLADFVDFFTIGDGEESTNDILDCMKRCKAENLTRAQTLEALSRIPGIYVPSYYTCQYAQDGTLQAMETEKEVPAQIMKRSVETLEDAHFPARMIVPYLEVVHDRISLEIMRGCTRGCRFCQAGMLYRPIRERSVETLCRQAQEQIESSGYEEVSLSSLSSGDYSKLGQLIEQLKQGPCGGQTSLSLPSLRLDAYGAEFMDSLEGGRKAGLTLAPEAGTQRLRDIINKNVTEKDLEESVGHAFGAGWNRVKLYFMIGLPGEIDEDILGIAELARKVKRMYYAQPKEARRRPLELQVSASNFVPKPHTPFQWAAQDTLEELLRKQKLLREALKSSGANFSWHDGKTSLLEAVFAKGDRRLGAVLLRAFQLGCRMDGWRDVFSYEKWERAFTDCGISMDFYAHRPAGAEEKFPWEIITCGVTRAYLRKEYEKALRVELTPDCRQQCNGCGLMKECGRTKWCE
ncbi:MAG: TIGR03960 family B12-binding radical SAM protein [Eubacteriales bacterium]|nr:TIGR03960 family B12-binding radical SAM protein [Eubacteriales bacterium]